MDLKLMQMAQPNIQVSKPVQKQESFAVKENNHSFKQILQDKVSEKNNPSTEKPTNDREQTVEDVVEQTTDVLESKDIKEVFEKLGVEYDETTAEVTINGEVLSIEQAMTMENIAQLLGMAPEQLQQILSQLTGQPMDETNIWAILEQAPQLLAQVANIFQGEPSSVTVEPSSVTVKEASQVAMFLKIAQTIGMKQDTVYQQEFQLGQTKEALQALVNQIQPVQQGESKNSSGNQQGQSFSQAKQEADATQLGAQSSTTVSSGIKTISITLPAERSQQSEALAKEIQNVLNRTQLANSQGQIKLMLKLFPENLGQIRIEIIQKDGVMQARLLATTALGKELLDSNLNQLKSAFVAQNIQMERIDIAQSLQDTDRGMKEQGFFNQFFKNSQQEEEDDINDEEEDEVSFSEFLSEQLTINEEV